MHYICLYVIMENLLPNNNTKHHQTNKNVNTKTKAQKTTTMQWHGIKNSPWKKVLQ